MVWFGGVRMMAQDDFDVTHPNDLAGRFAEFMAIADHLDMPVEERRGVLGVSAELWNQVVTLRGGATLLEGPQYIRRLGYAVPLMRRTLANRGAPSAARTLPATRTEYWGLR